MAGTQQMSAAMPFNASKASEYQRETAVAPQEGQHVGGSLAGDGLAEVGGRGNSQDGGLPSG